MSVVGDILDFVQYPRAIWKLPKKEKGDFLKFHLKMAKSTDTAKVNCSVSGVAKYKCH